MVYLIALLISVSLFGCVKENAPNGSLKEGRLILSESLFRDSPAIPLSGQWEFYWKKLYTHKDFCSKSPPAPDTLITLPRLWEGMVVNGIPLPRKGHATLRLKTVLDKEVSRRLGIRIGKWSNPLNLFIDDNKIASIGIVGTSARAESYDSRPQVAPFTAPGDSFWIRIHISNYTGKKSALEYPMYLGPEQVLTRMRISSQAWLWIIFGAILITGICLILAFFSTRPFHVALLYLGLSCVFLSLRSLFMDEALINELIPNLIPPLKFKLELSLLYGFVIFVNLYGRAIFPKDLKLWAIRTVWISHAFFMMVVLLFPYDIALLTQLPHHLIVAFDGLYILALLGRAVEIRRRGAVIFMSSLAVFFVAALHDMLVYHNILQSPYLIHFGFLAFIVIQTFLVTWLYSKSAGDISVLTAKLSSTQKQLQQLRSLPPKCDETALEQVCKRFEISKREREVVRLILQGASNNEIAEKMYISFHTVRRHINSIYRKCSVSEREGLSQLIQKFEASEEIFKRPELHDSKHEVDEKLLRPPIHSPS